MQSHAGLDSMNHLGADCRVVDVCADVDASEDGHDVEGESVTHGIYHHISQPPSEKTEAHRTNKKIWDEFRDSLPREVHRSKALPE
jgi:hypothetical protein